MTWSRRPTSQEETERRLEAIRKHGGRLSLAARELGLHRQTLHSWCDRNEERRAAWHAAQDEHERTRTELAMSGLPAQDAAAKLRMSTQTIYRDKIKLTEIKLTEIKDGTPTSDRVQARIMISAQTGAGT